MSTRKKEKVLVAMSGGVDSSVAALMLHKQGYEVIGVTMKTWSYSTSGSTQKKTGCCSLDDINDARSLAVKMGFQHFILDIRKEFNSFIISNFIDEYLGGRTPNPCVLCNTHIKWEELIKRAEQLGCRYIATGHYANVCFSKKTKRYFVSKGKDIEKDQSYVLWGLSQKNLSKTLLPLGKYTKSEIRKIAKEEGFEELARKSESYEICFVPDNDYRTFLKHRVKDLENRIGAGDFIDKNDRVLGKHKGYPFYTIGQRKGLELAFGTPRYVTEIDSKNNRVRLGEEKDLLKFKLRLGQVNYLRDKEIEFNKEYIAKIRYRDKGTFCRIKEIEDNSMELEFLNQVKGVTPGQSVVLYDSEEVIFGGIILK